MAGFDLSLFQSDSFTIALRAKELLMVRARRAGLALAAGLMLVTGCTSLSQHSLLSRLRGNRGTVVDCGEVEAGGPCCSGPMLDGGGPALMGPGDLSPIPAPQGTAPFLAPAPRLVPQPQGAGQSQPMPYIPPH
jgi:hypothetical protein